MVYRLRSKIEVLIWLLSLAVVFVLVFVMFPAKQDKAIAPDTIPSTTTTVVAIATTSTSTTTTTTIPATTTTVVLVPSRPSLCPEHYGAALAAGWTDQEWSMLDRIMHRESRCIPTVINDSYLRGGRDNSLGLTQINLLYHDDWVLPQLDNDPTRLYDPYTNLQIAYQLYIYLEEHGSCGWSPWRMPCD